MYPSIIIHCINHAVMCVYVRSVRSVNHASTPVYVYTSVHVYISITDGPKGTDRRGSLTWAVSALTAKLQSPGKGRSLHFMCM